MSGPLDNLGYFLFLKPEQEGERTAAELKPPPGEPRQRESLGFMRKRPLLIVYLTLIACLLAFVFLSGGFNGENFKIAFIGFVIAWALR